MKSKTLKAVTLSAAAAGTAALAAAIKKKKVDPAELTKKAANSVKLTLPVEEKYANGAALTPPMGWSSWNTFRNNINEDLIVETAKAMKTSGLVDAGYVYLNIDDCWQSSLRDENGKLQGDLVKFKSGIKSLVERINTEGMKAGIYSSNGTLTCEDLPASLGNEALDAATFAEWGVEYFKYDFCHNVPIPSRAPFIESISVSKNGENEIVRCAEDALLSGTAHIIEDDKLVSGKYIAGLSANTGAAEFTGIEAAEAGEYILTLNIRKKSNSFKYAEILVNATEKYTVTLPPTRAWSAQGRHQIKIRLSEGRNTIKIYNPVASRQDSTAIQYTKMGNELMNATKAFAEKTGQPEKPIVFSVCEWGLNLPWRWGAHAGNLWRTTPDIKAFWTSIVGIYEINVKLCEYAGPGSWNDPDMLEVGNGNLSFEENRTHFTLWCMMAAPLILGNDVRSFLKEDGTVDADNEILKLLTDKDMIAIDQDLLGMQCRRLKTTGLADTLIKPLSNNEVALCFFNKTSQDRLFEQSLQEVVSRMYIDMPYSDRYEVYDLWGKSYETTENTIVANVPGHGVKAYRVKAID